jgi:phospholipid/cholesterol/gamma-HCH transport system permease protein
VGAHTTSTVVQSLVAIILLNAIFAVMFVKLDI